MVKAKGQRLEKISPSPDIEEKSMIGWCSSRMIGVLQKHFPAVKWDRRPKNKMRHGVLEQELRDPSTHLALMLLSYNEIPALVSQRLLMPLEKVLIPSMLKALAPDALEVSTMDKKLYAIPEYFSPTVLLVRKDLWEGNHIPLPRTWIQLEDGLRQLKQMGKGSSIGIYGTAAKSLTFVWSLLGSNGISPQVSDDLARSRQALSEAYQWAKKINDEFGWRDSLEKAMLEWNRVFRADFNTGKSGCYICPIIFLAKAPSVLQKNMIVLPFPHGPSGKQAFVPLVGRGWCVPHNTIHATEAFKMIRVIQDFSVRKKLCLTGNRYLSSLQALWKDRDVLDRSPLNQMVPKLIKDCKVFRIPYDNLAEDVIVNSFLKGISSGKTPDQWIHELNALVEHRTTEQVKQPLVRNAVGYIEKNLSEIRQAVQVAAWLKISFSYLNQLFQKEMELSCAEYLKQARMKRAKELLLDPSFSIKEVSSHVGFDNPDSFSTVFKQYWGESPQAFRRS